MRTETIKDKYGEYYKVTYTLNGRLHTTMGGNRASLEAAAQKHITRYAGKIGRA